MTQSISVNIKARWYGYVSIRMDTYLVVTSILSDIYYVRGSESISRFSHVQLFATPWTIAR